MVRAFPILAVCIGSLLDAQSRPRGRDAGIPFSGRTGPLNAITDVAGVAIGHVTLISGSGRMERGKGPVRTGVTAILPRPKGDWDYVMAAVFNQNGNGDMTGVNWIEESGWLEGPVLLTGTHSVGVVRDAAVQWQLDNGRDFLFTYPVVAETFDNLNDFNGQHVTAAHARAALDSAKSGPVTEGAVGGGTGMGCNGFKGGIGTSSRLVRLDTSTFTIGVLVQCNYGGDLHILGVPVGREITDLRACLDLEGTPSRPSLRGVRRCGASTGGASRADDADLGRGSIVVIVATDAPLLSNQLERVAKRVGMGLGRTGSWASNWSGDLFLAFSTANRQRGPSGSIVPVRMILNDRIDPIFVATIEATEEAIVNAMLAAQTMTGADGLRLHGLPADRVMQAMRKYGRVQ